MKEFLAGMAARRFLYLVAVLIVLAVAALIAWQVWGADLMRAYMKPSIAFAESPPPPPTFYDRPDAWIARPGVPSQDALWTPSGHRPNPDGPAAIFYVHPTTYLKNDRWNAPIDTDDEGAVYRLGIFTKSQASIFNGLGEVWAPKYRQASFGAFLSFNEPDAALAFAVAYTDIETAFDTFLGEIHGDRPIILAGHSQGAFHLVTLLARRIAGTPVAARIAAAYLGGWPISMPADLPALGLPACAMPGQPLCIMAWQSYGEPAETGFIFEPFDATNGLNGEARAATPLLCTNPLTGGAAPGAPAEANLGALVPTDDTMASAELAPGFVGGTCTDRGYLSLGEDPPELGDNAYVLPGNNYHVYDYTLFWANLREDAERRVAAWLAE